MQPVRAGRGWPSSSSMVQTGMIVALVALGGRGVGLVLGAIGFGLFLGVHALMSGATVAIDAGARELVVRWGPFTKRTPVDSLAFLQLDGTAARDWQLIATDRHGFPTLLLPAVARSQASLRPLFQALVAGLAPYGVPVIEGDVVTPGDRARIEARLDPGAGDYTAPIRRGLDADEPVFEVRGLAANLIYNVRRVAPLSMGGMGLVLGAFPAYMIWSDRTYGVRQNVKGAAVLMPYVMLIVVLGSVALVWAAMNYSFVHHVRAEGEGVGPRFARLRKLYRYRLTRLGERHLRLERR